MINPYIPSPAEIRTIKKQIPDVTSYTMAFLDDHLQQTFTFAAGQFNMLSLAGIGEAAISFSSDPDNHESFTHTIRVVGNVTRAIAKLREGDRIWVRGPYGHPWPLDTVEDHDLMIIAGGIGLAPLRPVIMQRLAHNRRGQLELLYGARTPAELLFQEEYDAWQQAGAKIKLTVDQVPDHNTWSHGRGVVTTLLEKAETKPASGYAFVCGPEIMMRFVVRDLIKKHWPPAQIFLSLERRMECGFGICGRCQIDATYVCKNGPVYSYAVVKNLLGTGI
jgi:NAD(P)H-flavin reductase